MFERLKGDRIKLRKSSLHKNIPLLILDEVWLSQFPKEYKSTKITALEERLLELMKENARITETVNSLSKKKKAALASILELTTAAYDHNNAVAKTKMEKAQEEVLKINAQLPALEGKATKLPDEIEKANMELLEETVNICYNLLRESTIRLETVEEKVDMLRAELRAAVAERAVLKENASKTYNLLHNIIGPDMIGELDNDYERKRRKKWF